MLRRGWPPLLAALLLVLLFGLPWYVEAVNRSHPAPWPMVGGDAGLRNYTPASFPRAPQVLWSLPVEGIEFMTPLIGANGTIYVNAGTRVIAVGPDGKRRWAWKSPLRIWSLALSRQGVLYAMDPDTLHALDENGRLLWRAPLPGAPASHLIVGQGGAIYYAGGHQLHALADNGTHRWSVGVGPVLGGPVESRSGLILMATRQGLTAVRPTGEIAWTRSPGEPYQIRPVAAANGRIYLRTSTRLMVLNEEGEVVGDEPASPFPSNLAVGREVVQEGLSRRDGEGRLLWTAATGAQHRTLFTMVDRRGNLLVMTNRGLTRGPADTLVPWLQYELWDGEGRQLWSLSEIRPMTEPAVDARGHLCFAGRTGDERPVSLICIGDPAER
ncbi:MAG: PQQ-binding-like beta-propeller repeat protein [Bacillota bacterium]